MADVPKAPGVPSLAAFAADSIVFLVEDILSGLFDAGAGPQWGVFLDGVNVLDAESVKSFEFRQDFPISDYQVEPGSFESYDKVQLPAEIRLQVMQGGSAADRQAFLASIDAVMDDTELYDIVTPEQVYVGYNFSHRDFHRQADRGVGLIVVDIWLIQIRENASTSFTDTQQPTDQGTQNIGTVQPQATSSSFDESGFLSGLT